MRKATIPRGISNIHVVFNHMLLQLHRLLSYHKWLPIERCQLSFYSKKLSSLSEAFQGLEIKDSELSEFMNDKTLYVLVNKIIEYKNARRSVEFLKFIDPPDLTLIGDQLAFQVARIYDAAKKDFGNAEDHDFQDFPSQFYFDKTKFQQEESVFKLDAVFPRWLRVVDRLLTYPHWLPIERAQISFYAQKLSSFCREFQEFTVTDEDHFYALSDDSKLFALVRRILQYKGARTLIDLLRFKKPPSLTDVGDQLAIQVALMYKTFQNCEKAAECESQDFPSQFYFDKRKFQDGEFFVGFQTEASTLLQQLASLTRRHLQVISIVGMAGLGKTTLAARLYNDPYVVSYFYVRAWVTCSQVYHKRDLLLSILRSIGEITDDVCRMDDTLLAHVLYRALKGRRYLIVIDDIWSSKAWDDFKRCFPDDNNGSKIMLTTRLKDVALHAHPEGNPLCLRFLTEEESLALLRAKAFITGTFFDYLSMIGRRITRKCRGLPLAIVVIAGLLKNNLEMDWWQHVEESVSSYILTDENQYMDTLALSYYHLPQHLRPCFLSFGAFPEDHDIPVRKLIWLWVAEGFISQDGTQKSLENVAEAYLVDLIGRSLVVVGKKGSNGAIKTCRIHDLLRDLCLRKAEEECLLPNIYKYNKHSYSCPHFLTIFFTKTQLLLNTNLLDIPSDCCCSSGVNHSFVKDVAITWDAYKLIRALDISSIELLEFPTDILQLTPIKYLELRFRSGNPPDGISCLKELQTLVMSSRTSMVIPHNMWKLLNLKHLCINSGENLLNFSNSDVPSLLENLQTMSLVSPTRSCQHILARTSNLKKLGLCGPLTTNSGDLKFPDLGLLMHLETLKLLNTVPLCKAGRLSDAIIFPESLRTLSLSNTYLDWKDAWAFELIPNLEVLKLKFHAFVGKDWETSPDAFPRLTFLKLDELDLENWSASRNHFPMLHHLQVCRCPYLTEIPEDFGNICTLEWIELSGCSDAAENSARDIQKEQETYGNDWLKISLNPGKIP